MDCLREHCHESGNSSHLARARLSETKHRAIISIEAGLNDRGANGVVHLDLRGLLAEHMVKRELLSISRRGVGYLDDAPFRVRDGCDLRALLLLLLVQRADAERHLDAFRRWHVSSGRGEGRTTLWEEDERR